MVLYSYPEWQILVFCLLGLDQDGTPFVAMERRRSGLSAVSDNLGILDAWQALNLPQAVRERSAQRHQKDINGTRRRCKSCFYTNFGRMDRQLNGKSLFVFSKTSTFRRRVAYTCQQPIFKNIFLILVLLNCVTLAIQVEPDFDEGSSLGNFLYLLDWMLVGLFFLEVLFQAVAFQFVLGEGAYLRYVIQCELALAL